jgi:hypothetical protein
MTRGVIKGKVTTSILKERLGLNPSCKTKLPELQRLASEKNLITPEEFKLSAPTSVSTIKCYLHSVIKGPLLRDSLEKYAIMASKLYTRGTFIANIIATEKLGTIVEHKTTPKWNVTTLPVNVHDFYNFVQDENMFKQVFLPERWPSSQAPRHPWIDNVLETNAGTLKHLLPNWLSLMCTSGWDNAINSMYTKYRANVENHVKVHLFRHLKSSSHVKCHIVSSCSIGTTNDRK